MKDVAVIDNIIQGTPAIADSLGRMIINGVNSTIPCYSWGTMPKEQTNFPQIIITNATGDGTGRLVRFTEYNVTVVTQRGNGITTNGAITGQSIAREIKKAFDFANQTDTMTYATRVPQFERDELVYSPVIVRVVHKEI